MLKERLRNDSQEPPLNLCKSAYPHDVHTFLMLEAKKLKPAHLVEDAKGNFKERKCPKFPQDKTVTLTSDSESGFYSAYRDLMRFYASQILVQPDSAGNAIGRIDVIARSQSVISEPMKAVPYKGSRQNLHECRIL